MIKIVSIIFVYENDITSNKLIIDLKCFLMINLYIIIIYRININVYFFFVTNRSYCSLLIFYHWCLIPVTKLYLIEFLGFYKNKDLIKYNVLFFLIYKYWKYSCKKNLVLQFTAVFFMTEYYVKYKTKCLWSKKFQFVIIISFYLFFRVNIWN